MQILIVISLKIQFNLNVYKGALFQWCFLQIFELKTFISLELINLFLKHSTLFIMGVVANTLKDQSHGVLNHSITQNLTQALDQGLKLSPVLRSSASTNQVGPYGDLKM